MTQERLDAVREQLAEVRAKLNRLEVLAAVMSEAMNDAKNALADATQNVKVLTKDGD